MALSFKAPVSARDKIAQHRLQADLPKRKGRK